MLTDVSEDVEPAPTSMAADRKGQRTRRAALIAAVVLFLVVGGTGGLRALLAPSASSSPSLTVNGPSTEAKMLDLASKCVRDWANSTGDVEGWQARIAPCYSLMPSVPTLTPPPAGQAAAEPAATITRRTRDGLTATVVVRLRVTGPVTRYYSVDVGCRAAGACSLTTVPRETSGLAG